MAVKAKEALELQQSKTLAVLAVKGYHKAAQLKECHNNNIKTVVAIPRKPKQTDYSKPVHLQKDNFKYRKSSDTYKCPNGKTLTKQGRYKRSNHMLFDRYTIKYSICKTCPYFDECLTDKKKKASQGRYIDRYLNDDAALKNKRTVARNKLLYKKRQAIVEHPFGTIKRQWGYSYTLMKTISKVKTEFSIIFLCYNLKRTLTILGLKELKKALKTVLKPISILWRFIDHLNIKSKSSQPHKPQRFTHLCIN